MSARRPAYAPAALVPVVARMLDRCGAMPLADAIETLQLKVDRPRGECADAVRLYVNARRGAAHFQPVLGWLILPVEASAR